MESNNTDMNAQGSRLSLLVRQIRFEGTGINSYELVHPAGQELPAFTAGAHIDIHLGEGLVRQYSLCNAPSERHRYVIAVLRDEKGRGGSKALHEMLRVQDIVPVSCPRNNFQLAGDAKRVILLAGGIGITPLKSMAHHLEFEGMDYELHYCAKNAGYAVFRDELVALAEKERMHFHFDNGNPADGLDIAQLLREPVGGTHVYYCGPSGFMSACASAAAHWPSGTVHFEHFKAPAVARGSSSQGGDSATGTPGSFTVQIASTGETIDVPAERSLVEVLEEAGVRVEMSCQSGLCGTCKVRYLAGEVDHQDCILSEAQQEQFLTACVSRAKGKLLVLDL